MQMKRTISIKSLNSSNGMNSRQDLIKKNDYQRGWRSFLFERLLRHVVSREELD